MAEATHVINKAGDLTGPPMKNSPNLPRLEINADLRINYQDLMPSILAPEPPAVKLAMLTQLLIIFD